MRVPNAPPWPERIFDDVLRGHFYVDLESLESALRSFSAAVRTRSTASPKSSPIRATWCTGTTRPSNILAVDDEITGVVDWDGVCNGDRLFDLATLFYYTRTPSLRDYVVERVGDGRLRGVSLRTRRAAGRVLAQVPPARAGPDLIADGLELIA